MLSSHAASRPPNVAASSIASLHSDRTHASLARSPQSAYRARQEWRSSGGRVDSNGEEEGGGAAAARSSPSATATAVVAAVASPSLGGEK